MGKRLFALFLIGLLAVNFVAALDVSESEGEKQDENVDDSVQENVEKNAGNDEHAEDTAEENEVKNDGNDEHADDTAQETVEKSSGNDEHAEDTVQENEEKSDGNDEQADDTAQENVENSSDNDEHVDDTVQENEEKNDGNDEHAEDTVQENEEKNDGNDEHAEDTVQENEEKSDDAEHDEEDQVETEQKEENVDEEELDEKQIVTTSCTAAKVDLAIVLDSSGSIKLPNFELQKKAVADFVETKLTVGPDAVRVGFITFSTYAHLRSGWSTNKAAIVSAIRSVGYERGWTATAAALNLARDQLFNSARPDAAKILLLFTDGVHTGPHDPVPVSQTLKSRGIKIISIGIGQNLKPSELNGISSSGTFIKVQSFKDLADAMVDVLKETCKTVQQVLPPAPATPAPPAPPAPGPGPEPPAPEPPAPAPAPAPAPRPKKAILDVLFLLDASATTNKKRFRRIRKIARALIRFAPYLGLRKRIAVMTFGATTTVNYPLTYFGRGRRAVNAVLRAKLIGGNRLSSEGLAAARDYLQKFRVNNNPQVIIAIVGGPEQGGDLINEARTTKKTHKVGVIIIGIGKTIVPSKFYPVGSLGSYYDLIGHKPTNDFLRNVHLRWSFWLPHGKFPRIELWRPTIFKPVDKIPEVPGKNGDIDIVFLVDSAGATHRKRFKAFLAFTGVTIRRLSGYGKRIHTGVILYGDKTNNLVKLRKAKDALRKLGSFGHINAVGGKRLTGEALAAARSHLNTKGRAGSNKIIILLQGGNNDGSDPVNEGNTARQAGTRVIVIGITPDVDRPTYEKVADPNNAFFYGKLLPKVPSALLDVLSLNYKIIGCSKVPKYRMSDCVYGYRIIYKQFSKLHKSGACTVYKKMVHVFRCTKKCGYWPKKKLIVGCCKHRRRAVFSVTTQRSYGQCSSRVKFLGFTPCKRTCSASSAALPAMIRGMAGLPPRRRRYRRYRPYGPLVPGGVSGPGGVVPGGVSGPGAVDPGSASGSAPGVVPHGASVGLGIGIHGGLHGGYGHKRKHGYGHWGKHGYGHKRRHGYGHGGLKVKFGHGHGYKHGHGHGGLKIGIGHGHGRKHGYGHWGKQGYGHGRKHG